MSWGEMSFLEIMRLSSEEAEPPNNISIYESKQVIFAQGDVAYAERLEGVSGALKEEDPL